jgi:hypothetical protein
MRASIPDALDIKQTRVVHLHPSSSFEGLP